MASVKIRYLVSKRQTGGHTLFYWQPSKTLRQFGFFPRRVGEPSNTLEAAIADAERLNADLDRWRSGQGEPVKEPGTLPWLVLLYRESERYTDLKPKTQRSYDQGITLLEKWSESRGHPPLVGLEPRHIREMLNGIKSPSMRHLAYRTCRLLIGFAQAEGYVNRNSARALRVKGLPSRETYWFPPQVEAFTKAAEQAGRASLALAVHLGVNLGQREGDILRLSWSQYRDGLFNVRQEKTRRRVAIPASAELVEALANAAKKRKSPSIVVSETTGQPYLEDHFRHEFARIREIAKLPSELRFMDLRRTAVVRLAEAGCSIPEIAAITGHSLETTVRILEVYLPRTAPMARSAIARLDLWRAARTKRDAKLEA